MKVSVNSLNRLLDTPNYLEVRRETTNFLATHPIFKKRQYIGIPIDKQREHIMEQVRVLISQPGLINLRDQFEKPDRWAATIEPISYVDNNLLTKIGVMFGLFGSSMFLLGSEYHMNKYWSDIESMKVRGCFCMTELGHGSNVRCLRTTAHYDRDVKQFVLNTPDDSAQKYFIGALALHCTHAIVFAQLFADGKDRGVHAFVVQLRDELNRLLPGVHIIDCGPKTGLNGIDNGRLWLSDVRVNRQALLNRLASIDENGKYSSEISSKNARFGKMLSLLALGRMGVASSATNFAKIGLYIAIRYAFSRRQFALAEGQPEIPIIEYKSHQLRLFPLLARTYAINLAVSSIKMNAYAKCTNSAQYLNYLSENSKEIHILTCGIKALATWNRRRVLYTCRECCGGQAILASNIIGVLMSETESDITWEGDNTVLLQQVASSALKHFVRDLRSKSKFRLLQQYLKSFAAKQFGGGSGNDFQLRSFYLKAFEFRKVTLSMNCIEKFRRLRFVHDSAKRFSIYNDAMPAMLDLASAHIELEILLRFDETINMCNDSNRNILVTLFQLYAAHVIDKKMSFFQSERYFSSTNAQSLKQFILELCSKIKPHALDLVEAFNLDPRLIDAPIAHDWLKVNRRDHIA